MFVWNRGFCCRSLKWSVLYTGDKTWFWKSNLHYVLYCYPIYPPPLSLSLSLSLALSLSVYSGILLDRRGSELLHQVTTEEPTGSLSYMTLQIKYALCHMHPYTRTHIHTHTFHSHTLHTHTLHTHTHMHIMYACTHTCCTHTHTHVAHTHCAMCSNSWHFLMLICCIVLCWCTAAACVGVIY